MKSIEMTSHIGSDGVLRVDLLTEYVDQDVELVLVIQAKSDFLKKPTVALRMIP